MKLDSFLEIGETYGDLKIRLTFAFTILKSYALNELGITLLRRDEGEAIIKRDGADTSTGFYMRSTNSIYIRPGYLIEDVVRTFVHELGHALLHRDSPSYSPEDELEAELVSCYVLDFLGVDNRQATYAYIASHLGPHKVNVSDNCWSRVEQAALKIIRETRLQEIVK